MILFLYGTDTWRSRQKVRAIVSEYQKAYPGAVHIQSFECEKLQKSDFQREVGAASLFERKKLLILRNLFANPDLAGFFEEQKKQLAESDRHILVVLESEIKEKTKNKLYQWLRKNTQSQEFAPLPSAKLPLWIQRECARYGISCNLGVAEHLALASGNDLWLLSEEIRKIAAFKKTTSSSTVSAAEVTLLVGSRAQADIFATIDALASRNKKQAFSLLWRHLQKGDSPYYLFSMMQYQFRVLLEIRDMLERNMSLRQMEEASKLHPYVIKKGARVAQEFSLRRLQSIYKKLYKLDYSLKTGKVDPAGAFDLFVATL